MTRLIIVLALVVSCVPRNLASVVVSTAEPDAHCAPLYDGVGPDVAYSTVCRLPGHLILYCKLDKVSGFRCAAVNGDHVTPSAPPPIVPPPPASSPAPPRTEPEQPNIAPPVKK